MKAIINEKYGSPDILKFVDVEKPAPKNDEVLIKVHASSVNFADGAFLTGSPLPLRLMSGGLFKPTISILGADVSGTIESVGSEIKNFKPGDAVFGDISESGWGGFAEFVCAKEESLVKKPKNISFENAAATTLAAVTALHGLQDSGNIQKGQRVLVYGASGGVGTFAVQIAKSFETEVTAVCSTSNLDTAKLIGADYVIDYTKEDFTKNGKQYDLILAANGSRSISDYMNSLTSNGTLVVSGGSMTQLFSAIILGPLRTMKGNKKIGTYTSMPNQIHLNFVKNLLESGKISPVIEKRYSLEEVPEALRHLLEGHSKGKIVINVINNK